jgi:hypothetical protein
MIVGSETALATSAKACVDNCLLISGQATTIGTPETMRVQHPGSRRSGQAPSARQSGRSSLGEGHGTR